MPSSLDQLTATTPAFERAVSTLRALIAATDSIVVALPAGVPHLDAARARLSDGIPALCGEPVIDGATLVANMHAIATALDHVEGSDEGASLTEAVAASGHWSCRDDLAAAALSAEWEPFGAVARHADIDEHALITIADFAARPALRAGTLRVRDLLADAPWQRGLCPGCGSSPVLAELHGPAGERTLRCARCAAGWRFPRLACPACGERGHRALHSLSAAGEDDYRRVDCCERCGTYVKAIATLEPLDATALLEHDLATAGLDLIAVERGYHR
jgi:FdhE protein